jgi:hypothetical protein
MTQIFAFLLPLIFAYTMNQNAETIAIKSILHKQQIAWNSGDIDAFMQGYWNSEDLEFSSENGITKGWNNTLNRYKNAYPTSEKMGKLYFTLSNVNFTNDSIATLNGKWELSRKNDNPKGSFKLTFKKFDNNWLIIKDSTTSE